MKKQILLSVLLLSTIYAVRAAKYINLEIDAISWVDGVPGALDAEDVRDMLDTRRIVNNFFHGHKIKGGGFKKSYTLKGYSKPVSLNDIVRIEMKYDQEGVPQDDIRRKHLKETLDQIKVDFLEMTEPLLEKATKTISINMMIIKEWVRKTGRHDSQLLLWGSVNEREALFAASAIETKRFMLDLQGFLKDLMFNCPKARRMYALEHLDSEEKRAAFEKVFEQNE